MASRLMIRLGLTSDHLPTIAAALREVDATYLSTYAPREGHPVNLSPDPRAALHAGDPASLTARLASARAEQARLEERFRSYDGGDRAPSPPVSLMREERAAAQRVRDIEAEIAASKEQSQ